MSFDWYKNIISKIKNYKNKIHRVELNVIDERQKFKKIFEKNLALEKEISEKTEELGQANKSLLTLKHIWSTMNSSEPLSEVLSTVVNGLSEDLGYPCCLIFQIYSDSEGRRLRVRAATNNDLTFKIQNILQRSVYSYQIPLNIKNNVIIQCVKNGTIEDIKTFSSLFQGSAPEIKESKQEQLDALFGNRAISVLPIFGQGKPFGCLVVVSIRNEISSTEKNFLSLFAGQIELAVTIANLFEQIREQAITDGLTGLYNRRHFDQCLVAEMERAIRLKQPFTLITLDLDHLKFINDTYGHPAGDSAIRLIGKILKQNARSIDIPARFGGEEFALILPGIDIEGGLIAAERLRTAIQIDPLEGVGIITASIGVATFLRHTDSIEELLELVDQAMYRAKKNGRNQVQLAARQDETDWQEVVLASFIDILTKQRFPIAPKITNELIQKLKIKPAANENLSDFLYYIVDSLVKTYEPAYKRDYTREKVLFACKIAEDLNLSSFEIDKLKMAIILHDLGNMMIPENILLKPGILTEQEKTKILEHPILAAKEILKPIKSASNIISLIENHHEHWDGCGYPGNLSGNDIPVGSRILFVVDAYFAMINDRPYRKALSREQAIKALKDGANTEWDGKIIDIFVDILQKERKPV
ncbi:MAG: diguanylate cyclase [bacterium]